MEINSLLGIEETKRQMELRTADLRKFWAGFQTYQKDNLRQAQVASGFIIDVSRKKYGKNLNVFNVLKASETLMLFIYSVHLAKALQPSITKNIPVPTVSINPGYEITHNSRHNTKSQKLEKTWIGIGIENLLHPENFYTHHVSQYRNSTRFSVSEYLPDWVVVDTVLSGTEEYAHEIYIRFKQSVKSSISSHKNDEILKRSDNMGKRKLFRTSAIVYHTIDFEGRGLLWQSKMLQKHLPNWIEPTRKFISEVRQKKLRGNFYFRVTVVPLISIFISTSLFV